VVRQASSGRGTLALDVVLRESKLSVWAEWVRYVAGGR